MGKRVQNFNLKNLETKVINLGYVGENVHTQIVIECSEVLWDYPNAVASMVVQPPRGDLYPVDVTREENNIIWEITASDVVYAGSGRVQLTFTNNGEIVKSAVGTTRISGSIEATGEAPEPLQNWMDQAEETAHQIALTAKDEVIEQIQDAAEEARESIPADYTELSDDVSSLKSATNNLAVIGNLYSYGTLEVGKALNTLGNLQTNDSYYTTDYIDVTNATKLYANASNRYCFYDSSKTFIDKGTSVLPNREELIPGSGVRVINIPANVTYFRISVAISDYPTAYIVSVSPYEKYIQSLIPVDRTDMIKALSVTGNLLSFGVEEGALNATTGLVTPNSNYFTSNYIPISNGDIIYAPYGARYWYYDATKQPIYTANWGTATELINGVKYREISISNAAYLRITISKEYEDVAYIVKRNAYEAYLLSLLPTYTPERRVLYCIGDSITRGIYTNIGDTSGRGPTPQGYPYWIGQVNNYEVINLGESSGGFVLKGDNNYNIKDIVDNTTFEDADFVTIAFGINDWKSTSGTIQLGSTETSASGDGTVIGNMMYGIETIMTKRPSANLIIMLPMNQKRFLNVTAAENWSFDHVNNGKTLAEYRTAIAECAMHYGLQVIDPYTLCAINRLNIGQCLGDGLHPTLEFYKQMGHTLATYIH